MVSDRKVIFFVGNLGSGGLERFVAQVSLASVNRSLFNPIVICLANREGVFIEPLERQGIQVLAAPGRWQRSLKSLLALRAIIRDEKPDVVHSQVNFSLLQQFVASWLRGTRFIVTERNTYPLHGVSRLRRFLQFYALKFAGVRYSANSLEVARHLSRLVKYPIAKIPVIPNGVEVADLSTVDRDNLREVRGWKKDDFVVGYVARFAQHKGHSYFVHVMHEVQKTLGDRLKLCFVGDGPIRSKIESECEVAGLSGRAVFTGVISAMDQYYPAFDCTALLSEHEGSPNVVIEAMAYGLPVVANPVGNVLELFEGGAGVINDSTNAIVTAQLFVELAQGSGRREMIGQLARERISKSYSISQTLEILLRQYGFN